jgi:hypothetical protein
VFDLIGGRATWTALGLPTAGSVADRRRIIHDTEPASMVAATATIGDVDDWVGPVAVVTSGGVLVGSLDAVARDLPRDTPVSTAMSPAPRTIRPELRIDDVVERLQEDSLDHVFVTTVSGVLLGIVRRDRLHV